MSKESTAEQEINKHAAIPAPKNGTPDQPDELAAARALVAREKEQRREACAKEIEAVLAKHGCRLTASFMLTPPNRITPMIDVALVE